MVLTAAMVTVPPSGHPAAAAAPAAKPSCPTELPDRNAAVVTARVCGGSVAIADLTTATSEAAAGADGTILVRHHARPVRVQRAGKWLPVDTTLIAGTHSVTPTATAVSVSFSAGGPGPMATITTGGKTFSIDSPVGQLRPPTLDGDTATYTNVLPDVDLKLRADVDGFAQVLVVKTRHAATSDKLARLTFGLTGKGLTARADAHGNLRVTDAKGKVALTGNTPIMWDTPAGHPATDAASTHGRSRAMATTVTSNRLSVTPNAAMLNDPATVFPVYIDPGVTINRSTWAQVDSGTPTTAYWNSASAAQIGTTNAGTNKRRAFFNFDLTTSGVAGTYITGANLNLNLTSSGSCTAKQIDLYATGTATSTTTWNAQPAWGTLQSSQTVSKGYDASCPAGTITMDATNAVRTAVTGSATSVTLGLRSPDELDNTYAKTVGNNPTLAVTYTGYPTTADISTSPSTPCVTGTNRPYINTTTPVLQTRINDPEGALVRPEFSWSTTGGTPVGSAQPTPGMASGQVQGTTVPAGQLNNGGSYSWKVRGFDGTTWGPWSSPCEFTVDTTAPTAAPSVSSTTYPSGSWAGASGTAGTFTLGASSITDVAAYLYGLDTDPTTAVNATTLGGTASISLTPSSDGPHTLKVQSRDRGGNLSPVTSYAFKVGTGAVTAPTTGTQTAAKVTLSGISKTTSSGVTYQWRRGDVDTWTTIPAADVTTTAGGSITWPVATSGSGNYPNLVWNVAQTVNNAEAGTDPLDGPLQIRASFSGTSSGPSSGANFTLDRNKTEAASTDLGPGAVNLLTGNFTLSASDAAATAELGVERTFNSRSAADIDPMFGPGWTSSIAVPDAGAYTDLTVTGSLAQLGLSDGGTLGFTKTTTITGGATYTAEVGAESSTLTYTSSSDTYTLTEESADTVTFSRRTGDPAGLYTPTALKAAGTSGGSSISWEKVTIAGTDVVRPTQILARVPSGVTCGTLVKGCRALTLTYATTTTASGSTLGDYTGRLKQVDLTAWDPDLTTPAMRTINIQRYSYDSTGRLRSAWDPRLDYTSGGTQHVASAYTYNTDGTLATLTPPGEQSWSFTYTTVPSDSGAGRLYKVSRSALSAGTNVQTVVYNIPISGSSAPVDMAGYIARWGQTAVPVDATSVYPGDIVPDGNPATGTLPSNTTDDRVTVHYMDPNGRETNTMRPGGAVNATFYDAYGNIVRELTASNLVNALYASDTDTTAQEAALASAESTINTYSADGRRLLDTQQPEQDTVLPNWSTIRGRTHINYSYDEGAPSGGPYDLVTSKKQTVSYTSNGVSVETDKRLTAFHYDWSLRLPIETITDPDGLALTARTSYDTATRDITSTTDPAGNTAGTTPATRKITYYRAGTGSGSTSCDNHAEWATLPCRISVGGQPSTGNEVPTTTFSYDIYGQPTTVVEQNSTTTLRTSTFVYDSAGRARDYTLSSTLGTSIAKRRNIYATSTGRLTDTQTLDASGNVTEAVSRVYDTLGRLASYTDADNNTATKTYDLMSRPSSTYDGKATRTFTYNGNGEKRGLVTQIVDGQGGTFTATYNNDEKVDTETRPDGLTVRHYYNENASPTGVEYVTSPDCNSATCTLYYDYVGLDAHNQARWDSSGFSDSGYGYDDAGRLTSARQDTANGCFLRGYTFDKSTNRTAFSSYGPDSGGQCQDNNPTVQRKWTYDDADRNTDSGYSHDALGRTLTLPDDDTAAGDGTGDITNTYYSNDFPRTTTQGSATTTYNVDVSLDRTRAYSTTTGGSTVNYTHHYANDTDSPAWTSDGSTYTRVVEGIAGMGAIYAGAAGSLQWQVTNLHGDVVAMRLGSATGISASYVTDEYGRSLSSSTPRYGYLGDHQRSSDNTGGLVTMGVRLFNPATGRFLSSDPIYGGNANAFEYCSADPVNCTDLGGKAAIKVPRAGTTTAFIGQGNTTTCKKIADTGLRKCSSTVWSKATTVGWTVNANMFKYQLHLDIQVHQNGYPYGNAAENTCLRISYCRKTGPSRAVTWVDSTTTKWCVRAEGWAEYYKDTNGGKVVVSHKHSACVTLSPYHNVNA